MKDDGEDDESDGANSSNGGPPVQISGFPLAAAPTPTQAMVDQFTTVTGADAATATRVLQGALVRGLGLENAVSYYFETMGT